MSLELLSASGLTAAVSLLFTLAFILVPPLRTRFVALSAENQQAVIGIGILVIASVAVALGCAGVVTFIPCTVQDIGQYLVGVVVAAVVGDRVSKGVLAGARWTQARRGGVQKSLTANHPQGVASDGRLLR